ncbi:hypothetical protein [Clostridium sp. DJ247]|nr:hypothetical protein [Clostridium sp. DJ247]MBC2579785.1 hypothetical protein [Clostridium sp. DJ247]
MSNFKKLLITLIIILIVEIIFIYTRYKMSQDINELNIVNTPLNCRI